MVEQEPQDAQPQDAPEPQLFAVESLPEKLMRQAQESLDATEERLTELREGIAGHLKEASIMREGRDTLLLARANLKRSLKPRGRGTNTEAVKREQGQEAQT